MTEESRIISVPGATLEVRTWPVPPHVQKAISEAIVAGRMQRMEEKRREKRALALIVCACIIAVALFALAACHSAHPKPLPVAPKPPAVVQPALLGHLPAEGEQVADGATDVYATTETGQPMLVARLHRDDTLYSEPRAPADTGIWWTSETDADGVMSWRCVGDLKWCMAVAFGGAPWRVVTSGGGQ